VLALLGVLAACGDGLAGPDASAPLDAPHDLVTVQVRSLAVRDGARVFFQRPDSTVVLTTTTDASGRVQAYIPPHTTVTVELVTGVAVGNRGRTLYTQLDVNPGDELVIDDGSIVTSASISVEIPADEGGAHYTLHAPCAAHPSTSDMLVPDQLTPYALAGCPAAGDLLITSDNTGNFLYVPHVAFTTTPLQLAGPYRPTTPLALRIDDVPPDVRLLRVQIEPIDGTHELGYLFRELQLELDGFETSKDVELSAPAWEGQRTLVRLTSDDPRISAPTVYAWGPTGAPTTIEFGADLPRAYLTRPTYDPAAHRVGWLETDQGRLADAVLVQLQWFSTDNVAWQIFGRRGEGTSITLPVLPDPALAPIASPVTNVTTIAIDGGYDRLRALPLLGQLRDVGFGAWPMDAPTGRVTFQTFGRAVLR
jgi:hypothetical protein